MRHYSGYFLTMLKPVPVVFFVVSFVTDVVYWQTADMQWANISAWALSIGLIISALALILAAVELLGHRRIHRAAGLHPIITVLVLVLAIFDELIHTRDAYTSVVPTGLILSALLVILLLLSQFRGAGERRNAERRASFS